MSAFILYLSQQYGFTAKAGGTCYPVTLRQHPYYLAVRMLRYLADQRFAVIVRHPVAGLDSIFSVYLLVKLLLERMYCHPYNLITAKIRFIDGYLVMIATLNDDYHLIIDFINYSMLTIYSAAPKAL